MTSAERTITTEQYVKECFCKCAHIVASSRTVPSAAASPPPETKSQRWFQLSVNEHPAVTAQLTVWRRNQLHSMVVEVSAPQLGDELVEQWFFDYHVEAPAQGSQGRSGPDEAAVYKRLIVLVRTLYSYVRMLPAFKLCKEAKRGPLPAVPLQVRILGAPSRHFKEAGGSHTPLAHKFTPLELPSGRVAITLRHQPALAKQLIEATYQGSMGLPQVHIISDYMSHLASSVCLPPGPSIALRPAASERTLLHANTLPARMPALPPAAPTPWPPASSSTLASGSPAGTTPSTSTSTLLPSGTPITPPAFPPTLIPQSPFTPSTTPSSSTTFGPPLLLPSQASSDVGAPQPTTTTTPGSSTNAPARPTPSTTPSAAPSSSSTVPPSRAPRESSAPVCIPKNTAQRVKSMADLEQTAQVASRPTPRRPHPPGGAHAAFHYQAGDRFTSCSAPAHNVHLPFPDSYRRAPPYASGGPDGGQGQGSLSSQASSPLGSLPWRSPGQATTPSSQPAGAPWRPQPHRPTDPPPPTLKIHPAWLPSSYSSDPPFPASGPPGFPDAFPSPNWFPSPSSDPPAQPLAPVPQHPPSAPSPPLAPYPPPPPGLWPGPLGSHSPSPRSGSFQAGASPATGGGGSSYTHSVDALLPRELRSGGSSTPSQAPPGLECGDSSDLLPFAMDPDSESLSSLPGTPSEATGQTPASVNPSLSLNPSTSVASFLALVEAAASDLAAAAPAFNQQLTVDELLPALQLAKFRADLVNPVS